MKSLLVERRPNGNAQCESCNWHGPYKYCFVNKELALLESRIKELEEENKRFREALTEVMKVSGTSCLHYKIAMNALNSTSNDTNSKLTSNNINR